MKKLFLISFIFAALAVHAQIKVLSSGYVGVGTTSPQTLFHVHKSTGTTLAKTLQLTNSTTGSAATDGFIIRSSSASGNDIELVNQENGKLSLYTNNSERLTILAGGNIGINCTTPPARLTINSSQTNSTGISVKNYDVDLILTEDAATNGGKIQVMSGGNSSTIGTTPYRLLLQPEGGYVGIGTTSPSAPVHIHTSTGYSKSIQITNSTTGSSASDGFIIRSAYSNNNDIELINQEATGSIFFYTANSKRMSIDPNGNIGIGISQPLYKVHIEYSDDFPGIYINKSSTTSNAMNIVSSINATLTKSIVSINNGTSNFCVWGDGQVNIGGVYHDNTYKLTVYGSAYANGVWQPSDIRFKKDISNIDNPIEKLSQINGKKYKYDTLTFSNKNFPKGYTYGVIAQEVQTVLPELVQVDSAGYLVIEYDGLIPVIIEAVKAQQKTIKEQQEQINTLQDELSSCCNTSSTKDMMINNTNTSNQTNETTRSAYLMQNVPNPFSTKTTIRYYIPENTTTASLMIFDMQGKLIKTYQISNKKESYTQINGGEMQPGMYMYSLIIDGKELDTKRMILTE